MGKLPRHGGEFHGREREKRNFQFARQSDEPFLVFFQVDGSQRVKR